jgi:hypothetical protein
MSRVLEHISTLRTVLSCSTELDKVIASTREYLNIIESEILSESAPSEITMHIIEEQKVFKVVLTMYGVNALHIKSCKTQESAEKFCKDLKSAKVEIHKNEH